MSHRYGSRLTVHLDVVIHQQGKQLGQYQTRDISRYGVFLETGRLDLNLGDLLDLTFVVTEKPDDKSKIKAIVIRHSFDGVGLMLSNHCRQIFLLMKQQGLESFLKGMRNDNLSYRNRGKTHH